MRECVFSAPAASPDQFLGRGVIDKQNQLATGHIRQPDGHEIPFKSNTNTVIISLGRLAHTNHGWTPPRFIVAV